MSSTNTGGAADTASIAVAVPTTEPSKSSLKRNRNEDNEDDEDDEDECAACIAHRESTNSDSESEAPKVDHCGFCERRFCISERLAYAKYGTATEMAVICANSGGGMCTVETCKRIVCVRCITRDGRCEGCNGTTCSCCGECDTEEKVSCVDCNKTYCIATCQCEC